MHLFSLNSRSCRSGFTLVELLTVIVIIVALAALTIQVAGYANQKGGRARAAAEIAAMEAALESYKADNGTYPSDATTTAFAFSGGKYTDASPNSSKYQESSLFLYKELSGDLNADGDMNDTVNGRQETKQKTYFFFKDNMLGKEGKYIQDPFGYSYGYSTLGAATSGTKGFNPTFDLWSTGGKTGTSEKDYANWITNWN